MPTLFERRKAASDPPILRGGISGSPESLARGMFTKGLPVNPGELATSAHDWAIGDAHPKGTWSPGMRVAREKRTNSQAQSPAAKVEPKAQARVDEQSYESILPMKVENRRAPATGGHGIHQREGMNR